MSNEPGRTPVEERAHLARGYRGFAEVEAATVSPRYAELALAVAGDDDVLDLLAGLPVGKRQPNLLFATLQYLSGVPADGAELRERVLGDADRVRATMLARATQTNEPARCAALLPVLDRVGGPLALIEVGASAGLCLYPDRYRYTYPDADGGPVLGPDGPVRLTCRTTGDGPVPRGVPDVVARIGIDLNPLDAADPDTRAWLRALVWPGPGAEERLVRLDAALEVARREPARMLRGDLLDRLPDALALVPRGATPVVFHSAALVYLPTARRREFVDLVRARGVRWVSQEGPRVLPGVAAALPEGFDDDGGLALAVDGRPLARTAPHGGWIRWLPGAAEALA